LTATTTPSFSPWLLVPSGPATSNADSPTGRDGPGRARTRGALAATSTGATTPVAQFCTDGCCPSRAGASICPAGEGPVEVEGGADQCQVRERLREVAQGLAARPGLLGVQPQVVAVAQHLLEQQPGLGQASRVDPPSPGQGLDQPEAAHVERPLHPRQPVRGGR